MNKTTRLNVLYGVDVADHGTKELLATDRQIRRSVEQTAKAMVTASRESAQAAGRQVKATTEAARAQNRGQAEAKASARASRELVTADRLVTDALRSRRLRHAEATVATARQTVTTRAATRADREHASGIGRLAAESRRLQTETHKVARSMFEQEQASKRAARAAREQTTASARASRAASRQAAEHRSAARTLGGAGIGGLRGPGFALAGAGGISATALAIAPIGFEKQMDRVAAVSQATRKELVSLDKQAIQLGQDTQFSAREAADGMYQLATQGFSAQQIMRTMPGTLDLAAASATDLGEAAYTQASVIRQFGLDVTDAAHVADVLTAAVNSSAIEMADLTETMSYVGPVAGRFNQSFEDMAGAAAILGNVGIKGSMAGTTLRRAFVSLIKPSDRTVAALDAAGVSFNEFTRIVNDPKTGKINDLPSIFGDLAREMEHATAPDRRQALARLFGTEALPGLITLFAKGEDGIRKVSKQLEHSDGIARKTAATMRNNVAGGWDQVTGSIESGAIAVAHDFEPAVHKALLATAHDINEFTRGVLGGQGGNWAAELGRDLVDAGSAALDFARGLAPAGRFAEHVLVPLGGGAGAAAVASLKLMAGAATIGAEALGKIGDAAAEYPGLFKAMGIGLALFVASSPKLMGMIGGWGRMGAGVKLLLTPLRLVSALTTGIFGLRGAQAGIGILGRFRVAWLGVAAAERTAAGSGAAATGATAAGAGARGGAMRNMVAEYSIARAYGGSGYFTAGATGRAGGMGRTAALGSVLGPRLGAAARAYLPAAIGVSLVSGLITAITSQRKDFEGKFQDFLSGATLGIVPKAGKSFERKVTEEYGRAIDAGLRDAASQARHGTGPAALQAVLQQPRRYVARPGGLFHGPEVDTRNIIDMGRERSRLSRDLGRLERTRPIDTAGGPDRRDALLSQTRTRIREIDKAMRPVLAGLPKIAREASARGDYSGLRALAKSLANAGDAAKDARRQVERLAREARHTQFGVVTRNLREGGGRSLRDIRESVAAANRDMEMRGQRPGDRDFTKNQQSLTRAAVRNIKSLVKDGTITAERGNKEIRRLYRDTQLKTGQGMREAARNGAKGLDQMVTGWVKGFGKAGKVTDEQVDKIGDSLQKMPRDARKQAAQAMVLMTQTLEDKGALPRHSTDNLVNELVTRFGDLGNIDDPVKDPLKRIDELLGNLRGEGAAATGVLQALRTTFSTLIPKGFIDGLGNIVDKLGGIQGILGGGTLGMIGGGAGALLEGLGINIPGGREGGVLIATAGGEMMIDPGGRASMIPGDPRSDSTYLYAQPGSRIYTAHGQQLLAAGASPDEALNWQMPHFATGGTVRGRVSTFGPPTERRHKTASGVTSQSQGIAIRPGATFQSGRATLGKFWEVEIQGHRAVLKQIDLGPHERTGRRIDVTGAGARKMGLDPTHFPTDATGVARPVASGREARDSTATERSIDLRTYTAAQAREQLQRLLRPGVENALGRGFDLGRAGLGATLIDSDIMPDIAAAAVVPFERRQVRVSAGGGSKPDLTAAKSQLPTGRYRALARMALKADAIDKKHYAYKWGGGHNAQFAGPYDCSGAVSSVLHAGGLLGSPLTSGALARWGKPGEGQFVTAYSNPGHTYMRIGRGWFGTTSQNPKGGAGWFRGGARGGFTRTHPAGFRTGGAVGSIVGGGGVAPTATSADYATKLVNAMANAASSANAKVKRWLERLVSTIGNVDLVATDRLTDMRAGIQDQIAELAKGGITKREAAQIKRLRGALAAVEAEVGVRFGRIAVTAEKAAQDLQTQQTRLDQTLRLSGVDSASAAGADALKGLLEQQQSVLSQQHDKLREARDKAASFGATDIAQQIDDQMSGLFDTWVENTVRISELGKESARAAAQSAVDTAGFGTSVDQTAFEGLQIKQRLAGTFDSSAAAQERADFIQTRIVGDLEKERQALQQQYETLLKTDGANAESTRQAQLAVGQKGNEIAQAQLDAQEQTRDAAQAIEDRLKQVGGTTGFGFGGAGDITDLSALTGALIGG